MGQIHDIRSYLQVLETSGKLAKVERPVDLVHELANVASTANRQGRGATLFTQAINSPWQIAAGAVDSPELAALSLGCKLNQVSDVMGAALLPENGIAPQVVEDAPWKANILTGDQIDLYALPIPTHGLHDGGPFITGGVTVSHDPVTGRGNLSYNRMQVLSKNTFGFNCNEWRHTLQFYKHQEERNQPLQIAIAIGLDPAISIAAGARYDDDELKIAGVNQILQPLRFPIKRRNRREDDRASLSGQVHQPQMAAVQRSLANSKYQRSSLF